MLGRGAVEGGERPFGAAYGTSVHSLQQSLLLEQPKVAADGLRCHVQLHRQAADIDPADAVQPIHDMSVAIGGRLDLCRHSLASPNKLSRTCLPCRRSGHSSCVELDVWGRICSFRPRPARNASRASP